MAITNGYATLTEIKNFLSIPVSDTADDSLLEGLIESASRSIDRIANRRFYLDAQASARLYRAYSDVFVYTDDIGTSANLAVAIDEAGNGTYTTTLTLNSDFILDPLTAAVASLDDIRTMFDELWEVEEPLLKWFDPNHAGPLPEICAA